MNTFAEEFCKQIPPAGMRPPWLWGPTKTDKEGVTPRPIVSIIGAPTYKLSKYLAGLLIPLAGRCRHRVANSTEFVHTLDSLRVAPEDLMASIALASLFTRVPIVQFLNLLSQHLVKTF